MLEDARLDDPTILDDDRLLRRVAPNQWVNEPDGTIRPSSAVFKDPELSVNIDSMMTIQGRPPKEMLNAFPGYFLTSFAPGIVRQYDKEKNESHPIVRDTDAPNDPAHGLVLGKKTKSFANALVRAHKWLEPPP
jgi:hypothetical protein